MKQKNKIKIEEIIKDIEQYEDAINRHMSAEEPIQLVIDQYKELRDKKIAMLMDYLVEVGGESFFKNYVKKYNFKPATSI